MCPHCGSAEFTRLRRWWMGKLTAWWCGDCCREIPPVRLLRSEVEQPRERRPQFTGGAG